MLKKYRDEDDWGSFNEEESAKKKMKQNKRERRKLKFDEKHNPQ